MTTLRQDTTRRYIITGMSGTGKTSLLEQLRLANYRCFEEPARKILEAHLAAEGEAFAVSFIDLMLKQSVSDYHSARGDVAFYDRGLPDTVAYAIRFGVEPAESQAAAEKLRYESHVFVAPPWPEIFVPDEFRRASYDEYLKFHELLLETYRALGYTAVELPQASVDERMNFVQANIRGHT